MNQLKPGSSASSPQPPSTFGLWVQGMRPRTLPASIAPVVIGVATGYSALQSKLICPGIYPAPAYCKVNADYVAARMELFWWIAILCALVATGIQVAVNFANDYSDGVRGADRTRGIEESESRKPRRLTSSGLVPPRQVLIAAGLSALFACVCGLAVIVLTQQFWLLAVGAACLLASWFYSGGKHPYGYAGFGELFVFIFFGPVAVFGTEYAVSGMVDLSDWGTGFGCVGALGCGLLSCVMLMVNNLRDIDDDRVSGKRTLAVRLGQSKAMIVLLVVYLIPVLLLAVAALTPIVRTLFDWIASWFGWNCGTVYNTPPCPAGGGDCPTGTVATPYCPAALVPQIGVWIVAFGGVLLIVVAVLLLRAVIRRRYGPALALSSLSLVLFSIVLSFGALTYTIPLTYGSRGLLTWAPDLSHALGRTGFLHVLFIT